MSISRTDLTRIWATDDHAGLWCIARDIDDRDGWRGYLSIQEHEFFKHALEAGQNSVLWRRFLDGLVPCRLELTASSAGGSGSVEPQAPTSAMATPLHTNGSSLAHRVLSANLEHSLRQSRQSTPADQATSTPAPPQTITYDSRVLGMRVRFMLYDKALTLLYPQPGDTRPPDFDLGILTDRKTAVSPKPSKPVVSREVDDYDEEEDEEDEKDNVKGKDQVQTETPEESSAPDSLVIKFDESAVQDGDNRKTTQALANFNRTYQLFEGDREISLKQRKLEESDRQVDNDMAHGIDSANEAPSAKVVAQYGAANLSLKHLLAVIESKRDELQLTDFELKNLISDVRKNRSKWASEDKIGQEELYEAAEKVILELRGYTEHSTAFLNKVNKRDAPNYYNVIKNPMDLSTVMKKLKSFQYKSKAEFVSDLMLIWKNCLTYNTDPKHFLRGHAIAMQKKTLRLIPLIPDVTVRDRVEVEAEMANKERSTSQANNTGAGDSDEDEVQGRTKTSRKGVGKGSKTKKRRVEESKNGDEKENGQDNEKESEERDNIEEMNGMSEEKNNNGGGGDDKSLQNGKADAPSRLSTPAQDFESEIPQSSIEEESSESDEIVADVESEVWRTVFSQQRSRYALRRQDLFKDDKLQMDCEAILRRPKAMAKFKSLVMDPIQDDDRTEPHEKPAAANKGGLMDMLEVEKTPFVAEYEVMSGMPALPWAVDPDNDDDGTVHIQASDLPELTGYVAQGGLTARYRENLAEMQQIRRICSKISYIRDMHQNSYVHNANFKSYEPDKIVDVDIDLESRLPNRDPYGEEASFGVLRKFAASVAMHSGFETAQSDAVNALSELVAEFLQNMGRTLKLYMESNAFADREITMEDAVLSTLQNQGIESVADLDTYVREDVIRHGTRLQDLKRQLTSFLADLLRPGANAEITEAQMQDGSDQFTTGEMQEVDDDFFGFRELGLDKELGMLTSSVPFHLLHARLSAASNPQAASQEKPDRLAEVPDYAPVTAQTASVQIGLLRPFFMSRIEALPRTGEPQTLPEGDQVAPKFRNTRPKVPPTGKIAGPKKRAVSKVFFKPIKQKTPEPEPKPEPKPESKPESKPKLEDGDGSLALGFDSNLAQDVEPNFMDDMNEEAIEALF